MNAFQKQLKSSASSKTIITVTVPLTHRSFLLAFVQYQVVFPTLPESSSSDTALVKADAPELHGHVK